MALKFKQIALVTVALTGASLVPVLYPLPVRAEAPKAPFTEEQKAELEKFVKDFIMENPQVLLDSVEKHRTDMEAEAAKQAQATIIENKDWLTEASAPSAGNPKGDITIVEFFDYNCGYCVKALPDLQALLKADPNVRIVFRELSILGPTSRTAAQWALAAHNQGKYFDFHVAVMNHKGPKEASELEKIAQSIGLDVEKMKKDIAGGEIDKTLDKTAEMSHKIGVNGTPAFVVGTTLVPGYVGEEGLKTILKQERAKPKN